ncbi:DUF3159 domain-containing protein [Mycoplasmatota bacterium]|nr:DUF3159 domain-containing protein [Mycoplasmatota bacterium]
MRQILKDIYSELILVLKGKTLDTLIPPILFAITLSLFDLNIALIVGLFFSSILFMVRFIKKDKKRYAIFGFLGVGIAAIFSYLNQSAITYFIPDVLGSGISLLVAIVSFIMRKPLAAYVSHITRGWPIDWFLRDDVRPAYQEVTLIWMIYFLFRTVLETTIYLTGSVNQFVWVNTLLGLPLLIFILTVSYVYGIWRLRTLKGPGVDEYINKKEPPYKGQTKGF